MSRSSSRAPQPHLQTLPPPRLTPPQGTWPGSSLVATTGDGDEMQYNFAHIPEVLATVHREPSRARPSPDAVNNSHKTLTGDPNNTIYTNNYENSHGSQSDGQSNQSASDASAGRASTTSALRGVATAASRAKNIDDGAALGAGGVDGGINDSADDITGGVSRNALDGIDASTLVFGGGVASGALSLCLILALRCVRCCDSSVGVEWIRAAAGYRCRRESGGCATQKGMEKTAHSIFCVGVAQ
eukprot:1275650-Pleurochrysis_carterae.AAC.3